MKTIHFLLLLILILAPKLSLTQSSAILENIRLTQLQTELEVYYDISQYAPDEVFFVWVELFKTNGDIIELEGTKGDIGADIQGGKDKRIILSLPPSLEMLSSHVYAEIKFRSNLAVKSERLLGERQLTSLWKSALLPGLGPSQYRKKPFWLMGVVGYAAVGGAIYFNQEASKNYSSYLSSETISERQEFFDKADQQREISRIFGYGATAIWVGNIVWALLDKEKKKSSSLGFAPYRQPGIGLALSKKF